jgi:hypothetical protein
LGFQNAIVAAFCVFYHNRFDQKITERMNFTRRAVLFFSAITWELPQNMAGVVLCLIVRNRILKRDVYYAHMFFAVEGFGISLGRFVFYMDFGPAGAKQTRMNMAHEYGHSIQSMMLGPMYLPLAGVPSILRSLYSNYHFRKTRQRWKGYFQGYPERWANRLGDKYFHIN